MSEIKEVGRVAECWVYPFKSMQGVQLPVLDFGTGSARGDRVAAANDSQTTGTPTLVDTLKYPGLLHYTTAFANPEDIENSPVIVTAPDGKQYDATSPELLKRLSEESGRKIDQIRLGRGLFHSAGVSVMSLATIDAISNEVGAPVDPRRFRENLLVETLSGQPFEEDNWIKHDLFLGETDDAPELIGLKLDKRCGTINLHPETAEIDSRILKAVIKLRGATRFLGIYCSITKQGRVSAGAKIYAIPRRKLSALLNTH